MTTISTAVGLERIARISGYKIKKGVFSNETQNLPQIIAVFGEANTANQAGLTTAKQEITSAKQAAELYGYGSPLHRIMRILRPINGDGVGGIPTVVFPQLTNALGSSAYETEWTVTGTANSNTTHYIVINGRHTVDFQTSSYEVVTGDTPTIIAGKMKDAINKVLGHPLTADNELGVLTATSKWKGKTANEIYMVIDYGNNSAGLTYTNSSVTNATGSVDVSESLSLFGDEWYTSLINPYGDYYDDDFGMLTTLEQFNGMPSDAPTGRWSSLNFKPFMAFTGLANSYRVYGDLIDITNNPLRVEQVTNVICPAPNSPGFGFEVAANVVALFARKMQDAPHSDVSDMAFPDMPIPFDNNIGDMSDYNNRDLLVKNGCSTVILENGAYKIQDLVTTYHPEGEVPLQFSYCRNLNLDWNVKDSYTTLERIRLRDKTLISDNQNVSVSGVIKPKEWKGVLFELFDDLAEKALINDPQFSKDSLQVQISSLNPNRFETFFRYKRTGLARIESTDVEVGF